VEQLSASTTTHGLAQPLSGVDRLAERVEIFDDE
jgi:hypothetical protein